MKKQKGITLIALVITIIVMMILVAVTISVSLNGGLFSTAKKSTTQMDVAQEKEQLLMVALGALNENGKVDFTKLDDTLPEGFTGSKGTYVSTKTGNTYEVYENGTIANKEPDNVPEDLLYYLLGAKDETTGTRLGRDFNDVFDDKGDFKNVPEEIGTLTLLTKSEVGSVIENDTSISIVDVYFLNETKDGVQTKYKFRTKINEATGVGITMPANGVKEIKYDENTRVGKYVEYDNKNWIIMYDDSVNGLQMISEDALLDSNGEDFYLGWKDGVFDETKFDENVITEIDGVSGKSNLEKAMYSYDNAITRLNNICNGLVADAVYIKSVRSVGSNPQNPNFDNPSPFIGSANTIQGYGTSTWFEDKLNLIKNVKEGRTFYTIGDTDTEYKIKGIDTNFENDFDRMVALEIYTTNEIYWLASRSVYLSNEYVSFNVRLVLEYASCQPLWDLGSNSEASTRRVGKAVRPVVTLDPDIQFEGEGSKTDPYIRYSDK